MFVGEVKVCARNAVILNSVPSRNRSAKPTGASVSSLIRGAFTLLPKDNLSAVKSTRVLRLWQMLRFAPGHLRTSDLSEYVFAISSQVQLLLSLH